MNVYFQICSAFVLAFWRFRCHTWCQLSIKANLLPKHMEWLWSGPAHSSQSLAWVGPVELGWKLCISINEHLTFPLAWLGHLGGHMWSHWWKQYPYLCYHSIWTDVSWSPRMKSWSRRQRGGMLTGSKKRKKTLSLEGSLNRLPEWPCCLGLLWVSRTHECTQCAVVTQIAL